MKWSLAVAVLSLAVLAACRSGEGSPFAVEGVVGDDGLVREVIEADGWEILRRLEERTGRRLHPLPHVVIHRREDGCPPQRGGYDPDDNSVHLYLTGEEDEDWIRGVLSHELAHALAHNQLGQRTSDPTLTEGFATWASVPYWQEWQPWESFEAAASLPEETELAIPECSTESRDYLYAKRAAFLDYLVERFGRGMLYRALASEEPDPFLDVYGIPKPELVAEWGGPERL